ncbi:MAG: hypothetical protein EA412_11235 [Chitinophagaceae bacterium]|nr:MAG: hypothetical protein EA412_11235 [Chitinophagaceae bacterium]
MVRLSLKIALLSLLLSNAFVKTAFSQEQIVYHELSKYSKWSFVAGPVIHNKAELTPQYGELSFKNKPMLGFNAGILYDFYPDKKWSFQTGLIVAKEPIYSISYTILNYDLYENYPGDLVDKYKSYALYTFSFPLILRLNLQTSRNAFTSLLIGFKAMYFPHGTSEYVYAISSEELSDYREIFGLKLESPKNSFQGSFLIGPAFSYSLDKFMLKTNIIYVMNFQNTFSGEYQFANLFTSPDTRGYYNLSGNYLGLLFSISFKKRNDNIKSS